MDKKFQLKPRLDAVERVAPTRKVRCQGCGGRLYYVGEAEHKPEYFILVKESIHGPNVDGFYIHQHCWKERFPNKIHYEGENLE
jgi:hypothetical protein